MAKLFNDDGRFSPQGDRMADRRRHEDMPIEEMAAIDARLRTLEQNLATELGENRQFRHDIRNWRTALDGEMTLFQQELLRQSERLGRLEQYQARHEAEYKAKMEQLGNLAAIEEKISNRIGSIDHKVNTLIVEKAMAKWIVGLAAGLVVFILETVGKKLGWM